jgi:hypothetical protein
LVLNALFLRESHSSEYLAKTLNEARITRWYSADYGLDDQGVPLPVGAGNFSLHRRVQTGSGAHPASYPIGTGSSFPGGKAAGV